MKFIVELELTLEDGPRCLVSDVDLALIDELEDLSVSVDDSKYSVTVLEVNHHR
jgi:hypothetical protein